MNDSNHDQAKNKTDCYGVSNFYKKHSKKNTFLNGLLIFGILNLLWFLFRTGTKPSRIVYPCQKAALKNISLAFGTLVPILSLSAWRYKAKNLFARSKKPLVVLFMVAPLLGGIYLQATTSVEEIGLNIISSDAFSPSNSDIFVVNGRDIAHIQNLIDLMGSEGFNFYQSSTIDVNQGPDGLISSSDIILLKINAQWSMRGGTNTDMLKELIQVIVDHPDGFTGEIIVADNGQGSGVMDRISPNSEDQKQSSQDVVDYFSENFNISTFTWDLMRFTLVQEYSVGDMDDGYIVYDTQDAETGINVSYPKFETDYGTKVSFKNGIWNGTHYEDKLKVINLPVLKSHGGYGVTATLKNYMGVQTQGLANGHQKVATGGMGTLMVECGLPTLNIIDCIWVNANPANSLSAGPATSYREATRVNILIAGVDPAALDYWSSKYILMETSKQIGYTDTH
ncbi:MAG: DUF362 domain-containing protein, partial [Asgard group archaeon]|nr:DUF362 domain-containing protein [Asgard group archaeon]